ncbi:MAG TPA: hypothetical protein VGP13_03065 [Candidatus Paceibacterota bacterium]|jgi:hypothetical protein|nr:hypothetical protein [Candidatus Paceibacterota bacterium]
MRTWVAVILLLASAVAAKAECQWKKYGESVVWFPCGGEDFAEALGRWKDNQSENKFQYTILVVTPQTKDRGETIGNVVYIVAK